jgi:hypothetical protein
MPTQLRIARPVTDLSSSVEMYQRGLDFEKLGSFTDHDGFDGAMLGNPGAEFHLEFTMSRRHPIFPATTAEDLLVFYVPEPGMWDKRCEAMLAAGFKEVQSFNPYWAKIGRTFEDRDSYRVVIQRATWTNARAS